MNVSVASSSAYADMLNPNDPAQKIRADMQNLSQALQSGDLASAQSAYTQLQNDAPGLAKAASSSSASANSPGAAFATLGNALQSGDLSGAQQAFTQLQQMTARGHRGHHHRDNDGDGQGGPGQDLGSLATALQSGDLSGAQSALTALLQALPNGAPANAADSNDPFSTLATALQSGDLPGAQNAFAAFLQSQQTQSSLLYGADGNNGLVGGQPGSLIDATA